MKMHALENGPAGANASRCNYRIIHFAEMNCNSSNNGCRVTFLPCFVVVLSRSAFFISCSVMWVCMS